MKDSNHDHYKNLKLPHLIRFAVICTCQPSMYGSQTHMLNTDVAEKKIGPQIYQGGLMPGLLLGVVVA